MTAHSRTPPRARLRQEDRAYIGTYEKAIWRLVQLRADPEMTDREYDLSIMWVADFFWVSDTSLRRDVRKAAREIDPTWRDA